MPHLLAATLQGERGHGTPLCRASETGSRALAIPVSITRVATHMHSSSCRSVTTITLCQMPPSTYDLQKHKGPESSFQGEREGRRTVKGSGRWFSKVCRSQSRVVDSSPRLPTLLSLPVIKSRWCSSSPSGLAQDLLRKSRSDGEQ